MPGVVLTAAVAYAAFTLLALALHGWDPFWFVWMGTHYASGGGGGSSGYDGQFVYYIARDGWAAIPHLDAPGYRFGRILAPALAGWLGGGSGDGIAWAMLAINYAAVVAGTAVVAAWLAAAGLTPWWALAWPFSAGIFLAYSRDLTEPLAYAIAAAGAVAWLRQRPGAAVPLLALAALGRETTLLVPIALALAALAGRDGRGVALAAASALPWLVWQAIVASRLDGSALVGAAPLELVPLGGALPLTDCEPGRLSALLFVGLPALALAPGALAWVWRAPRQPLAWLIALHCLLTLALSQESYLHLMGVARQSLGLLLALLLAFPLLSPGLRAAVAAVATVPALLWLVPVLAWAP